MSQQQKQLKITLIGDNCQDHYEYVSIDRLSPEAPVPVCVTQHIKQMPGMAANVKENLINLGCSVNFYSGKTSIKKRIIDIKSKQHIIRIDNDVQSNELNPGIIDFNTDAIVLSDYNKGYLTYDNMSYIIKEAQRNNIPVFIDTKKQDLAKFNGSFVKINDKEYKDSTSKCDNLIVTHSGNTIVYKDIEYPVNKIDVVDVCGAGDTFLASLVYKYLISGTIEEAIPFAIKASSVTVQNMGVYAPTLKEIE